MPLEGKRISQLIPDTSPTTDDFIVSVDSATMENKRVDLGSLPVSNPTAGLLDSAKAYGVIAKAKSASIPSSYGYLGQKFTNGVAENDLVIYGESTQADTPTPDAPVLIESTTGDVTVRSSNKNLISNRMVSGAQNGLTFTVNPDKSITIVGTATANFTRNVQSGIFLPAAATLTISGVSNGSIPTYYLEVRYKRNGTDYYPKSAGHTQTVTTVEADTTASAYLSIKSGAVINETIYPQVEIGPVATSYEPGNFSTQTLPLGTTQLRSLPNGVSDRIYKSGSSWFLEQNVGTRTITAVNSLVLNRANTTSFTVEGSSVSLTATGNDVIVRSSHFPAVSANNVFDSDIVGIASRRNELRGFGIGVPNAIATDMATFNTWLASNPVTADYLLATPIATQITDPTLITALENIRTYQGITNITASTPVSGSYGLDMTTSLAGKANTSDVVNKSGDTMTGELINSQHFISTRNGQGFRDVRGDFDLEFGTHSQGHFSVWDRVKSKTTFSAMDGGIAFGTMNETQIIHGTGFPNGVISAPVGSIYIDKNITNGASSWIKKSGTGNTGWEVLEGDTGWRDVTSLVDTVQWKSESAQLHIRRIGSNAYLRIRLRFNAATGTAGPRGSNRTITASALPVGFRRGDWLAWSNYGVSLNENVARLIATTSTDLYGVSSSYPSPGDWTDDDSVVGGASYITVGTWPTTLPGTPA